MNSKIVNKNCGEGGRESGNKIEQLVDEQDEIDKLIQQGVEVLNNNGVEN